MMTLSILVMTVGQARKVEEGLSQAGFSGYTKQVSNGYVVVINGEDQEVEQDWFAFVPVAQSTTRRW